ncbi:MAG: hypothetical protein JW896_11245 [Deltaproteobacteria bacterium]|nr:hypothetical protein [Deltaproteobacteria bacterium]
MKRLTPKERRELVDAAMGRRRFDLLIKNVKLVNVFSGEIYPVEIGISHGYVTLEDRKDLNFIAVFNRHKVSGNGAVGIVGNFRLSHGAVAGTVSHDCHNLCVVYTNLKDAIRAIEEVRRIGGGIVFSSGNILKTIALPVAGLMSRHEAEELIPDIDNMNVALREAGIEFSNPVMRLATAALPVIPNIKITDLGIVDVVNQRLVGLFVP